VTWYEQLVAAGRPQMLPTSNVRDRNAAFRHVGLLWCFGLQTPVDNLYWQYCNLLRNIQPVQLGMQQMGQAAVVLASVAADASSGIQYSLKIVSD